MHFGQQEHSCTGLTIPGTGIKLHLNLASNSLPFLLLRGKPPTEYYPDKKGALMCQLECILNNLAHIWDMVI